ncbi:MAG: hypothetical protein N0A16_13435, partial [Blastocatellia bacterium]|nr:hypothetical protein [Blastocatellia bacterium]
RSEFRLNPKTVDENREFVRNYIRYEVVTAAHGIETAAQVLNDIDLQLLKAIEVMPKAEELAESYRQRIAKK